MMKNRIQRIMLLMLVASIGIVAFQLYWLRNTYIVTKARFEQEVMETLLEAIDEIGVEQVLKQVDKKAHQAVMNVMGDSCYERIQMRTFDNTKGESELRMLRVESDQQVQIVLSDKAEWTADSTDTFLEQILASLFSGSIDLAALDSAYQAQLEQRGINLPHFLEMQVPGEEIIRTLNADTTGTPYLTPFVSKVFLEPYELRAGFPSFSGYIFREMGLSLLASIVLMGLIIGSFWYLLQVIFEQKKLSEIKNDFINNMTHELKTPIAILSAANEALTQFDGLNDRAKTNRYLGIFGQELERLSNMVEEVLNSSIYEKSDFELDLEAVDLSALLAQTIQRFEVAQAGRVEFAYESDLASAVLQLDRVHFGNVLNNLLDNAIKYSNDKPRVQLSVTTIQTDIRIQITDNGIGISKAQQQLIFDKFYRVPTGNLHKVKGFGLGLSYVQKMIQQHGGTIDVQSELGKGSTFTINLPKR